MGRAGVVTRLYQADRVEVERVKRTGKWHCSLYLLNLISPPRPGSPRFLVGTSAQLPAKLHSKAPGQSLGSPPRARATPSAASSSQLLTSAARGRPKNVRHGSPGSFKL